MTFSMETKVDEIAREAKPQEADAVIRLERVHKEYAGTIVIHALDLAVRRGEFLTLLGPSGCGKTTTLKMIAGFERPSSGRILLDGEDVSETPPYERHLNTVFQQYALFPHMTVRDNVAFGPRTAGLDRETVRSRVDAALAMVNMAGFAGQKPAKLSGGQQQRVALARALVNMPSALLLDEPLSALDVKLRRAMQLELKRIQTEVNTTFIFVTHDQDEALTMSTRIAVMNAGRIEQLDTPEEIYQHPRTPFVAGFIGQANLLPGRVSARSGGEVDLDLDSGGRGRAAAPGGVAGGDRVLLMLRPEQVNLMPASQAGSTAAGFPARLRAVDFQGSAFRYALLRDDGREVIVTLLPQHQLTGAAVGDAIWVSWDGALSWVVPEH
jgi:spermidine/putrescine transport system ATP-binding protein